MTLPLNKPLLRSVCAVLLLQPLLIPAAVADTATPLVDKVRNATARYLDINVALAEGFVPATPCVSGPDTGAMGVHFVLPSRIGAGVLNAEQPEALIYEPMANGVMRLVGVEFIVLESVWAAKEFSRANLTAHSPVVAVARPQLATRTDLHRFRGSFGKPWLLGSPPPVR